jgi:hypothetical protein
MRYMSKLGRRLEKEEEWHRLYSTPSHPRIYESKFASGEARISLPELQLRWRQWNQGEQVQFATAFGQKNTLDSEDEKVLEFLAQQDHGPICATIALLSTQLSDRAKAGRFLMQCIEDFPRDRANFLQALSVLAAPESVPVLLRTYEASEREVADNPRDHGATVDLLYSAVALFKLIGQDKYRNTVVRFLNDPRESVRTTASLCMQDLERS